MLGPATIERHDMSGLGHFVTVFTGVSRRFDLFCIFSYIYKSLMYRQLMFVASLLRATLLLYISPVCFGFVCRARVRRLFYIVAVMTTALEGRGWCGRYHNFYYV